MITLLFAAGCNTNKVKQQDDRIPNFLKPVNKFEGVQFASRRDTICGMPISAGVEDTLILRGKIYGFCSTECKNMFLPSLKKQHKK